MKKVFLMLLAAIVFTSTTQAQEEEAVTYKNAIGVRLSSSAPAVKSGITYKHFFGSNAVEGILSFGDGLTSIAGLYEIHKPFATENLQWLLGAGGYIGFGNKNTLLGVMGIIGVDYKFSTLPLNLTLDWKPELNIVSKVGFEGAGVGFSARFTF